MKLGRGRVPFGAFRDDLEPSWLATRQPVDKASIRYPMMARREKRGGGFIMPARPHAQLVVTRVSYAARTNATAGERDRHARNMRGYARYIERDGGQWTTAFDREGEVADARARVADWSDDRRYFRLSLNPQHGNAVGDFRAYTRDVMARIEDRLLTATEKARGLHLDWIGAVHTGTGRQYSHVLLRGMVGRADLFIDRHFITRGIRMVAREVASRAEHLGVRSSREVEADRSRDGREALRRLARDVRSDEQGARGARAVALDGGGDE